MQFFHILEQSPRDWETNMCQNVVVTINPTQVIYHHVWKNVRTTSQCIVGLQLREKGHEMEKNYGINLSRSFPCFLNFLPGIGEKQNIKVWF